MFSIPFVETMTSQGLPAMNPDDQLVELLHTEAEQFVSAVSSARMEHLTLRLHTRDARGKRVVSPWHVMTLGEAKELRDRLDHLIEQTEKQLREPAESAF
jgi:hypothetical protein